MHIDQWWNFFYLCGSAAVTLTGLTFLVITLGVSMIKKETLEQVHLFVSPICYHFIQVFILCCFTAIPHVRPEVLGIVCIISPVWHLKRIPHSIELLRIEATKPEAEIDRSDWITTVYLPCAIHAALLVAGVAFFLYEPWAVEVLAGCCLVQLVATIRAAWSILLWVAATIE